MNPLILLSFCLLGLGPTSWGQEPLLDGYHTDTPTKESYESRLLGTMKASVVTYFSDKKPPLLEEGTLKVYQGPKIPLSVKVGSHTVGFIGDLVTPGLASFLVGLFPYAIQFFKWVTFETNQGSDLLGFTNPLNVASLFAINPLKQTLLFFKYSELFFEDEGLYKLSELIILKEEVTRYFEDHLGRLKPYKTIENKGLFARFINQETGAEKVFDRGSFEQMLHDLNIRKTIRTRVSSLLEKCARKLSL